MGKSLKKFEKVEYSGEKWLIVGKSCEKLEKVGKSGKKWEKLEKVGMVYRLVIVMPPTFHKMAAGHPKWLHFG